MSAVILVFHLMIAVALVGFVLLQRSEGGALGMGGGGGGGGGFMSSRGTANLLTRMTTVLAALFFLTSITLSILARNERAPTSIIDSAAPAATAPAESPGEADKPSVLPDLQVPATPSSPQAPISQ